MRRRPLFWLFVSMVCVVGVLYLWQAGDKRTRRTASGLRHQPPASHFPSPLKRTDVLERHRSELLSQGGNLNSPTTPTDPGADSTQPSRLAYRLSNPSQTMKELSRSQRAVLLENALIGTSKSPELALPDHLRAKEGRGAC